MEKSAFTTKRKKRKTRKCLDELRKRSRRSNEESTSHYNSSTVKSTVTSSSLVTTNRLTLSMFTKAVQSETITRPVLAELKQQNNIHNNIENEAEFSNSSSSEHIHNYINVSGDSGDQVNVREIELNVVNQDNDGDPQVISTEEYELFSPSHNSVKDLPINIHSSTSNLSQSSEDLHYDELMEEVAEYFKKLTAAVVHEDVIKKSKLHLQKLYVERCQKEYEKNILKCIRSNMLSSKSHSSEETHTNMDIMSSPIITGPNILRECPVSLSESSECELSPPALGISTSSSDKELFSCSPGTITSPEIPQSDHPEYIYCPHRFN